MHFYSLKFQKNISQFFFAVELPEELNQPQIVYLLLLL